MAKRKKAVDVLEGAVALSEAQTIVKRLVEDAELREALGTAIDSSRRVYERVAHAKKPTKLLDDKKLQSDARDAVDAIRTVAIGLTGVGHALPSKKRKKGFGLGRLVLLGGAGGAVAMVASEQLRSKVLDALFGAEEEFEYSPPPPAAPTETSPGGSSLSAV